MQVSGRTSPLLIVCFAAVCTMAWGVQKQVSPADGQIVGQNTTAQDSSAQEEPDVKAITPSVDSAWGMLTTACHKAVQTRIVALAALGTMGTNPQAAKLIREGMTDQELEVRLAAILAAEQTKNRALLPALGERLGDSEPQVVFTAAATLWKMGDHSGEDVLMAVADGERKANPSLMHGAKNDVNKELHNPGSLAELGATSGASLLLGPFGFGVGAVRYMLKSGADPARASAVTLLAESHAPGIREELIDALKDKDAAVRAAAAKALGQRHDPGALQPLGELFNDKKVAVRLTAAAAYINCSRRASPHARKHT